MGDKAAKPRPVPSPKKLAADYHAADPGIGV